MGELKIKVKKLIIHPKYSGESHDNDITILYLTQEVDITTYTPACLPKANDPSAFDGKMALAAGNFFDLVP